MSNSVFPSTLPGIDIKVSRRAIYSTKIQTARSGKELRASWWATPRYAYTLTLNFVRQAGFSSVTPSDEAATLVAFFETHRGAWDSFLFDDPYDAVQRRVRFNGDELELERLANKAWDGKTISLISVK